MCAAMGKWSMGEIDFLAVNLVLCLIFTTSAFILIRAAVHDCFCHALSEETISFSCLTGNFKNHFCMFQVIFSDILKGANSSAVD